MQKYYSVAEISVICGVSSEQVRRWVRNGKLKGEHDSRKTGFKILESDFEDFITKNPKYKSRVLPINNRHQIAMNRLEERICDIRQLIDTLQHELIELEVIMDLLKGEA